MINLKQKKVGIDCDVTFSLVICMELVHLIFSLITPMVWSIYQMDVKSYFLK